MITVAATRGLLTVAFTSLLCFAGVSAEAQYRSPEAAAIAFVFEADSLNSLGQRLAIDAFAGDRRVLSPTASASVNEFAESVGARVFRKDDVLECPPRPSLETPRQRCRFSRGVEQMLSVGQEVRETDLGLMIWVYKSIAWRKEDVQAWDVGTLGRQVLVRQDENGNWQATGFGPSVQT